MDPIQFELWMSFRQDEYMQQADAARRAHAARRARPRPPVAHVGRSAKRASVWARRAATAATQTRTG